LREHYVLTLRHWIANLDASQEEAVREVGAERVRVWRLYMLGAAHAFATGEISVFQVLSARGGAEHGLPLSRRALIGGPA
jgi:cyclopropane-fatty-acyl-phospholipid synthase